MAGDSSSRGPAIAVTSRSLDGVVNAYVTTIADIYDQLSRLPSLKPSASVDRIFTQLVDLCVQPVDGAVVSKLSLAWPSCVG